MSTRPTPTTRRAAPTAPAVLEHFYSIKQATRRLGIADPDNPDDTAGEKWLRDGINQQGWDCYRMSGRIQLSESQLAEIAAKHLNLPDPRVGKPTGIHKAAGRRKPGPRKTTGRKPATKPDGELTLAVAPAA